jgi:hypothetical protein
MREAELLAHDRWSRKDLFGVPAGTPPGNDCARAELSQTFLGAYRAATMVRNDRPAIHRCRLIKIDR